MQRNKTHAALGPFPCVPESLGLCSLCFGRELPGTGSLDSPGPERCKEEASHVEFSDSLFILKNISVKRVASTFMNSLTM